MLEVVVWDVRHGSATYIKTPNSTHIVQDLGTGDISGGKADFSPLLYLKNRYGVSQLDYVIISHPHRDHIDDIFNLDALSPRVLLRPKHLTEDQIRQGNKANDDAHIEKYLDINQRYNQEVSEPNKVWLPSNNGGVVIKSFLPTSCGDSNLNNHSIVMVFEYAESKIIIPGDNEPPSWKELLENKAFCNAISGADILIAPHHGRESGFCEEIFDYFKPRLTIISDGPCESSAVAKYANVTQGWKVHCRRGGSEERKCVTTRHDGEIYIKLGYNNGNKRFIEVRIN
jgi:beta-lactamase superfamily II metal-dependent hydrolase